MADFANRIVEDGVRPAREFIPNPQNWRQHPKAQQKAIAGSLESLGWLDRVKINVNTGHILDGHARVELAKKTNPDMPIPYTLLDLTEAEERLALAIFDPITGLAETNVEILEALMSQIDTGGDERLDELIAEIEIVNGVNFTVIDEVPEDYVNTHQRTAPSNRIMFACGVWADFIPVGDDRLMVRLG